MKINSVDKGWESGRVCDGLVRVGALSRAGSTSPGKAEPTVCLAIDNEGKDGVKWGFGFAKGRPRKAWSLLRFGADNCKRPCYGMGSAAGAGLSRSLSLRVQ